ncbi:lipid-A-disaccharide synthase [Hyphococcus lacteus]|uniref:Lipid-A-disaccharide synthase n=1 Tax=Hyphococcus lacteus TaxID=3143536 RepID=A0ABV3Z7H1_9PROT
MSKNRHLTIMVCAVEPSADDLGASLMKALKAKHNEIDFVGSGGPSMIGEGLKSLFPIEPFSVIGPIDALRALPAAVSASRILANNAAKSHADACILIDSWAFAHLAAKTIRKQSPTTKLIKYVAPQVWASRPNRAKTASELFDAMLCLFEFEPEYFEKYGLSSTWVGHSGFQDMRNRPGEGVAFRSKYGISNQTPLLAVLPGSRKSEVQRLQEPFRQSLQLISQRFPNMRTVIVAAPNVAQMLEPMGETWPGTPIIVEKAERHDAFAAANAALAASGTVVTELAIQSTPTVVAYRVGRLTATWARRVITTKYASLINIAAQREVVPEFIQENCEPQKIAAAVINLLSDGNARAAQIGAFPALVTALTGSGDNTQSIAANAVLDEIWPK